MTSISLYRNGCGIGGFTVNGHSGYAETGSDIVCAAITTAVRLVHTTLAVSMALNVTTTVDDDSADISLFCDNRQAQNVLDGFYKLMVELSNEYPQHIKITEVRQNA